MWIRYSATSSITLTPYVIATRCSSIDKYSFRGLHLLNLTMPEVTGRFVLSPEVFT